MKFILFLKFFMRYYLKNNLNFYVLFFIKFFYKILLYVNNIMYKDKLYLIRNYISFLI